MKKKIAGFRVLLGICAAFGWWGFFYPELSLTPDNVRMIQEQADGTSLDVTEKWQFDSDILQELLQAKEGEICFKSKVFRLAKEWWEYADK